MCLFWNNPDPNDLFAPSANILIHRVFLFDRIESSRAVQPHLNAIYFVRPTPENIKLLCKELNPTNQQPSFGQYFLFFSNHLSEDDTQLLAQADAHELVQLVQEHFVDFVALSSTLADLLVPSLPCLALGAPVEVALSLIHTVLFPLFFLILPILGPPSSRRKVGLHLHGAQASPLPQVPRPLLGRPVRVARVPAQIRGGRSRVLWRLQEIRFSSSVTAD